MKLVSVKLYKLVECMGSNPPHAPRILEIFLNFYNQINKTLAVTLFLFFIPLISLSRSLTAFRVQTSSLLSLVPSSLSVLPLAPAPIPMAASMLTLRHPLFSLNQKVFNFRDLGRVT